ncbi:sigma-70 family RNA polymerase sigma factor [Conexibacter sp. JD483]|uniref:sigma-70 family RNA polymerase sigma factor n=1 Tax=unclassified Conexibacter TaxID=2627773 RepID=UPI00271B9923|nr:MULTISPECIES: sigma-70 family RNA polymerase sigma factor [unclassified Conexibacter]MDO8187122.1 sigma-70 family RNA polymerase sigma factor [Conexibacter sp. CPCC 205706]MDO8200298.1 sigma-70 family RNA polymerase sigma factor [Conexibacter sp. CPCC 205762]MDR9368906.1 sigma-70 family RNA polymerase sigma factor [Conexibacter sp. JD483]
MWDSREFSETYRRLAPAAVRAAERVLHDRAAAEDVAQDVFARLWERPDAYDPARGSLASYVTMVARSRALDRWRSRQAADAATERLSYDADLHSDGNAVELAWHRQRVEASIAALREAPDEQRQAVLLAYGAGLSAREVAAATKVPIGTAKSRIRLGLIRTREALAAGMLADSPLGNAA